MANMAYLDELAALTDQLISAVASSASIPEHQRQRLDGCRESTLRTLRHHNFGRTNQFEVDARLNGLEERFRVTGREVLADEFRARLDALEPLCDKWSPDVLHFILELADQPAQKSDLRDLYRLTQPEQETLPKITWRDIAREDGWHEERDIWRTIDYSPSSDDDDEDVQSRTSADSLSTISSADDHYAPVTRALTTKSPDGEQILQQARDSQSWRHVDSALDGKGRSKKVPLTSLQLLREALFMLCGLETSLFNSKCNPVSTHQLSGVSWQTHKALISSFAECGWKLAHLRRFVARPQQVPLLQVFQDSVHKALRVLDWEVAQIQGRLVSIKADAAVSVMGVLTELGPSLTPLYALSSIVQQLQDERNAHAFRYLELLFEAAGMAQIEGSYATYRLLGGIFFDCFQIYLKPIRLWMEEGRLLPGDRTFFVSESSTKQPLHLIWKSQFNLLRTPDGSLHAPRFLQPAITRIFTTGKSIVVLKHLKKSESFRNQQRQNEPPMDFATVCPEELEFAPFSELFNTAFNTWIQSKHHTASATLRSLLFNSYGLSQGLDALQCVYLMADGSKSDAFHSAVFRHLDTFSSTWKDRFTLTEIAQEAFSSRVDAYRLSAKVDSRPLAQTALAARSSVRVSLPAISLSYRLPWPVRIIVPEEAIEGYRVIFTFLLQVRRVIYVLTHPILNVNTRRDTGAADQSARYYMLRNKLLWFCNTMLTYLTTLVLAPSSAKLRDDLGSAVDVDEMIVAHVEFIAWVIGGSCQGAKLQPIRDCMLDVLDLAIKMEDAHQAEMALREEEEMESSRLSVMSSPYKSPRKGGKGRPGGREVERREREEDEQEGGLAPELEAALRRSIAGGGPGSTYIPYPVAMREMHAEFERHLRFIAGGLRGVARASRDEAAGKWDLLAEMLEVGIRD